MSCCEKKEKGFRSMVVIVTLPIHRMVEDEREKQ